MCRQPPASLHSADSPCSRLRATASEDNAALGSLQASPQAPCQTTGGISTHNSGDVGSRDQPKSGLPSTSAWQPSGMGWVGHFAGVIKWAPPSSCMPHPRNLPMALLAPSGEQGVLRLTTGQCQDEGSWTQEHCMQAGDAYLIVYSITDRASFEKASELRIQLRRTRQSEDIPIILVGNKCDLVRRRQVSVTEGRACAVVLDCKFIETSAAVHHNVQEMFEGIVRQVRLRRDSKEVNEKRMAHYKRRESLPKKAKHFLDKIVAKNNKNMAYRLKSKSCHDLSVL
ncbi:UNVERIFIED_CONTAM: hypothetical protein FKN15_051387 [Acipenser sinensis]